ncbi:MAG: hypothetical protein IJN39_02025 [Clostridia bacterium]|nr:hypothetical protein [Clostridia bacterium]
MNITVKTKDFSDWKKIVRTFVHGGDLFEIRCWQGENEEFAGKWGELSEKGDVETVYQGNVTNQMLKALCTMQGENEKITSIFTVSFTVNVMFLFSEKYGTEIHILNADEKDKEFFVQNGIDITVY